MWHSATSSESRASASLMRSVASTAVILVAMAAGGIASGSVLVTVDEALRLAFPDADTTRETVFLSDRQSQRVEALCGHRPDSALVTRFRADHEGDLAGWAYLDTHRVRTLPESLLVVVSPAGEVIRVEVVTFREPLEYLPRAGWYAQFEGRALDDELELERAIRPVTGATLTARATTDAVRRVLAIHRVLDEGEGS